MNVFAAGAQLRLGYFQNVLTNLDLYSLQLNSFFNAELLDIKVQGTGQAYFYFI